MKLLIAGSRTIKDPHIEEIVKSLYTVGWPKITEVICGEATGVDLAGKEWAEQQGIDVHSFPAKWKELGKKAGYVRNVAMIEHCDGAIIFWDGQSPGTKHTIDLLFKSDKIMCLIKED